MAHGLQLERSNDRTKRWRPECRCGWSGEWTNSQQRARDEYAAHRRAVSRVGTRPDRESRR
jgi:hypothetical protein